MATTYNNKYVMTTSTLTDNEKTVVRNNLDIPKNLMYFYLVKGLRSRSRLRCNSLFNYKFEDVYTEIGDYPIFGRCTTVSSDTTFGVSVSTSNNQAQLYQIDDSGTITLHEENYGTISKTAIK